MTMIEGMRVYDKQRIGMYDTWHFCVYCYANTSKDCVLKNASKQSIIGWIQKQYYIKYK